MALRGVALSALSGIRSAQYAKPLMDWKIEMLGQDKASRDSYLRHCDLMSNIQADYGAKRDELTHATRQEVERLQRDAALAIEASLQPTLHGSEAEGRRSALLARQTQRAEGSKTQFPPKASSPLYLYKTKAGRTRRVRPYPRRSKFSSAALRRWEEERKLELQRVFYKLRAQERDAEARLVQSRDVHVKEAALAKQQGVELRTLLQQSERKLTAMRTADLRNLEAIAEEKHAAAAEEEGRHREHFARLEEHTKKHLQRMDKIHDSAQLKVRSIYALSRSLEAIAACLFLVAVYRVFSGLMAV